ncbi:restriction endonuclease subunit S [Sphingobacterium endophyticum]|uniref:restriction endonuclease subunit S n=1 Tax=Sphingobacterium endophyticum TaxID=2546448 RepID=UPI0012E0C829|nr:restriction endonuclease subunit S [Sphingobacterium endophyticum]
MEKSLPKGWVISNIEESVAIFDNMRKPVSATERAKRSGDIPYYGATGLAGYIDDYLFDEELVLIGEDGAPFFDKQKNVAFIITGKSWVNNHAHVLKAKNNSLNKFILHYLNQFDYTGFVRGTTRLKLTQGDLRKIPFPLPPLPEQERIVAKLDTLFHKIDSIRKRMDTIGKLKGNFFESIFYENTGLTTLSNFVVERKEKVGENWVEFDKIGVSAKDGIIDLDVGTKMTFEKYKIVEPGDIIYNTMRINIGSIAIYEGKSPAITSPDYVVFRVKNASKYLILNYLKSEVGKMNISSVTTGSVRSRLYFKNLMNIPFPEITSERHKSAESILKWFELSLAKMHVIDIYLLNKFEKAILHKAFKGELVPQLPTDGDAKDLFSRDYEVEEGDYGKAR